MERLRQVDELGVNVDEGDLDEVRFQIVSAMTTPDGRRVADALVSAVQRLLDPAMVAGFVSNPGEPIGLRRFVVKPGWQHEVSLLADFTWMHPLMSPDAANGASLVGPKVGEASLIAAVMDRGRGRRAYFVILGEYQDPERARERLAAVASVAGESNDALLQANHRLASSIAIEERERLSRDLHDSLSQSLWSLSILSETADSMTEPDDPLHPVIRQISELSLASQEEMRSLLINLRSNEVSDQTIVGALESLVRDFRASHDIELAASIAGADLDARTVVAFRRIAEEALNNVGRHSGAAGVLVLFDTHTRWCRFGLPTMAGGSTASRWKVTWGCGSWRNERTRLTVRSALPRVPVSGRLSRCHPIPHKWVRSPGGRIHHPRLRWHRLCGTWCSDSCLPSPLSGALPLGAGRVQPQPMLKRDSLR